jgi:hypothetical protein
MVVVLGNVAGAVYRPVELIVPHSAPEQPAPLTRQRMAELGAPETAAWNCWVPPAAISALAGVTFMTSGRMIVTVSEADFVLSAFDVAVTVTCAGLGTVAGAVKRPLEEIVPQLLPEQPLPLTLQVTAVFEVPPTDAVNCC